MFLISLFLAKNILRNKIYIFIIFFNYLFFKISKIKLKIIYFYHYIYIYYHNVLLKKNILKNKQAKFYF